MLGATLQPASRIASMHSASMRSAWSMMSTPARAEQDALARGAVGAHALAALVRRLDERVDLGGHEVAHVRGRHGAVAGADRDLDDVAAAAELLARRLAEGVGAVDAPQQAVVAEVHEPG